ncbi:hypothetical protein QQM39_08190 [Streptomyces sp. DT2A-34]|uniref:hypothetical protein n=1 Tax=Streptomyces sp. DT2A-34 TaxID=3051182 RepID=UPI00265BBB3A|nr:hypothetical protein [Streptomyces sp. DT2A-34]MDO0910830.1 hypothetical protein [Streptomyces sp. DT2A-34]
MVVRLAYDVVGRRRRGRAVASASRAWILRTASPGWVAGAAKGRRASWWDSAVCLHAQHQAVPVEPQRPYAGRAELLPGRQQAGERGHGVGVGRVQPGQHLRLVGGQRVGGGEAQLVEADDGRPVALGEHRPGRVEHQGLRTEGAEPAAQRQPGAHPLAYGDGGDVGELQEGGQLAVRCHGQLGGQVAVRRVVQEQPRGGVDGVQADQLDAMAVRGDGQRAGRRQHRAGTLGGRRLGAGGSRHGNPSIRRGRLR